MDVRTKAVIVILPFALAGYLGYGLAYPAIQYAQEKSQAVDDRKAENDELQTKLREKAKLDREKRQIDGDISSLRGAVPKNPELELLNIDIEKMCMESGVELLQFKEADADALKKAGMEAKDEGIGTNMGKGKEALANRVKSTLGGAAGDAAAGGKKAKVATTPEQDAGLAKITMAVKTNGDYYGLTELVKRLETYQRVIAISSIQTSIPKKADDKKHELPDDTPPGENDALGSPKKLNMSFMLTAYYLP